MLIDYYNCMKQFFFLFISCFFFVADVICEILLYQQEIFFQFLFFASRNVFLFFYYCLLSRRFQSINWKETKLQTHTKSTEFARKKKTVERKCSYID
jgi:nicotinamide riboside transporter PnuC